MNKPKGYSIRGYKSEITKSLTNMDREVAIAICNNLRKIGMSCWIVPFPRKTGNPF